jgi:hypothetical protein
MNHHFIKKACTILVCLSALLAGKSFAAIAVETDGLQISCAFKKIKIRTVSAEDKTRFQKRTDKESYVYGEIVLSNKSNTEKTYNLRSYYISVNEQLSSKIYIDSIADYIILEKTLKPNEVIKYPVYWVMEGVLKEDDLLKAKIVVQSANQK